METWVRGKRRCVINENTEENSGFTIDFFEEEQYIGTREYKNSVHYVRRAAENYITGKLKLEDLWPNK